MPNVFNSPYEAATVETQVWVECSETDYNYGLECLPPALWEGSKFLVGEPSSHTAEGFPTFQPFFQVEHRYYRGQQPMTRAEFRKVDIHKAVAK